MKEISKGHDGEKWRDRNGSYGVGRLLRGGAIKAET